MIRLSVNVNKVATLRNSRGGKEPKRVDPSHDIVQTARQIGISFGD
mgnify:CR=1 FL=1